MRYAVVGSRRRLDRDSVERFVDSLAADSVVISGGSEGVDSWAIAAARDRGLEIVEIRPDRSGIHCYGEAARAYHARNRLVAAAADVVVAFVASDRKGGTENTIKHARRLMKPVIIL